MRTRLACVAWAVLALGAGGPAGAVRAEREKFQGAWALESEGRPQVRLTFTEDRVTVEGGGAPRPVTEPYALDPSKSPKELDIGRGESRKEFIYKWDGDRLVLAFPFPELVAGGTFQERQRHTRRPRDFKETEETAQPVVWVLKRVER
jgi:uncharacterized protein (TIGR03067 family)